MAPETDGTSNGEPSNTKARNLLKPPVLVLGWISRIVVAVARSLHRHGVPVDAAHFEDAPAPGSRAIREFRRVPRPDLDPAGFVEQLSNFIRQCGHDMVIPTDDQALVALTEHYHDLKDLTYIACPRPEITGLVLNKASTLEVARRCGLPIPNSKVISDSSQLFDLRSSFPFPWVLKPAAKEVRVEERKSYTLATAEEVAAKFPIAQEFTPPMLLQEYCTGSGVGVEMLMHEGNAIAIFQHQRLKEFPYTGGVSVTAIAEPPNSALVEKSLALLRALQWEGAAMVEFKVNPRDGRAVLMEVNGRYWGTIALPISAGINFPLYHWQLVHGETPAVPDGYSVGTQWRWTAGHVVRLHDLLVDARRSSPARKELLHSLVTFPASFDSSTCHALFSASDPMPAVVDLVRIVKFCVTCDVEALSKRFASSPGRQRTVESK